MGNNIIENGFLSIDSIESRLKFKKINGASKQATRDGSNIFNIYDKATGEKYEVQENDWIEVTLDNTEGTHIYYYNIFTKASSQVKTSTTYYLVAEIKNVSGNGRIVFTSDANAQISNVTDDYFANLSSGQVIIKKITTKSSFEGNINVFLRTFIQFNVGWSGSITFRLSVLEKQPSEETFVYQPYGIMPSPNYPSKVETVGSNVNEFSFENAKKIDSYSISSYKVIDNNAIELKGSTDWAYIQYQYVLKANIEYTISYDLEFEGVENISKWWMTIDDEQGSIYANYITLSNNKLIKTFIPKTENVKIKFFASIYDGKQIIPTLTTIRNIKLEQGTKATPYSKHGQGSVEIDVGNKNLIDINNLIKGYVGISSSPIVWTTTSNERTIIINANKYKGLTLTVSSDGNRSNLAYLDTDTPKAGDTGYLIKNNGSANTNTFTILEQPEHPYIAIQLNFGADYIPTWCQLEVGEKATEKVEHQSQSTILPIQEEMLEDDYIDDVEYHTWGKKILTGNENWVNANRPTDNDIYVSLNVSDLKVYGKVKCTHFRFAYNWTSLTNTIYVGGSRDFLIRIDKNIAADVNTFKTWLQEKYNSGNPVVVYYKLAEPKSLPLTEEQKEVMDEVIYLYEGITNISIESNVFPTIETEVKKIVDDYDIYISTDGHLVIPEYDIRYLIDLNESSIPSMPEAVEISVRAAGRDGDVVLNTTYEPMSFNITCYTDDNLSITEKTENERKINAFLNSIKNKTKRFAIEKDNKFYNIKYNAALTTINYPAHIKFSIPFKSSDSYAKDLKEKTIVGNSSQESNTINDVGAIFIIKGPATDPIISFNDYSMEYSTSILEGARIEIDSNKSTITHINSDGIKTNVMKYYNHQFPKIENGNNTLKILSGINDEQQVKVKWNDLKL